MEFHRITVDPRQMGGVYPDLEREDIREALRYAAAALQERELPLLPSR